MNISKILKNRQVQVEGLESLETQGHDHDDYCQHDYEIATLIYFIRNINLIAWQEI